MDNDQVYTEATLPFSQALGMLREELHINPRIMRLLLRVAELEELALYRQTVNVADAERLLHLTACAQTVRHFVNKITAEDKSAQ